MTKRKLRPTSISKAFKFRLYPTRQQEKTLFWTLARCRELYNAALSERKDAYRLHERYTVSHTQNGQQIVATMLAPMRVGDVNYYQQKRDLVQIKAELRAEYQHIHSQVLQNVLERLEKAFQHFFRRVKKGETPGYPRFAGRNRYNSFTYPQGGSTLSADGKRVTLSKIGSLKIKLHRPI